MGQVTTTNSTGRNTMTTTTRTLAALAGAALLLTACSGTAAQDPAPAPTPTVAEATPTPTRGDPDLFHEFLEYAAPELAIDPETDAALYDFALEVCDYWDAGATGEDAAALIVEWSSFDTDQVGAIIGGAVVAICPEHEELLP